MVVGLIRPLPLGPFLDAAGRHGLPEGQMACCSDRTGDERPRHFQQIVDWVKRREVAFPADPVEPPDYLADLDLKYGMWSKIRKDQPVTRALWEVELACGHFGETSAPSLAWRPGDPPTTVSEERAAEMTAEWEEHYAVTPLSWSDTEADRAHRRRMLALRWPTPEPEIDCWPCSYARRIEAYEYIGPLAKPVEAAAPRRLPAPLPSHRGHGVPLETYELTPGDHRNQKAAKAIRAGVAEQVKKWRAEEAADPELRAQRAAAVVNAWTMLAECKTRDDEIMQWRVRLYCGHTTMTSRHCSAENPTMHGPSSMQCPECGMDPARIVAYEPVGLVSPRPDNTGATSSPPPKPQTRKQLEARIAELEQQLKATREDSAD
ncbi:hypothetical protein ACFROC_05635 [Nocardia tengchongensis]|uniref:hypothetical protein n=1 Tax=Nocardia tengchongensis TaxID=2055889 RepID=UPI0036ACDEA5